MIGMKIHGPDGEFEFGDWELEDAYDSEDRRVSWANVYELKARYDDVLGIEDDEARLEAAKALVAELYG
jgi:hypothetical protein